MVTHPWHAFVLLKLSSFRDSQNEDAYPHPNTNVKYWYTSFAKHHNERDREKETAGLAIDRVYARLLFICQVTIQKGDCSSKSQPVVVASCTLYLRVSVQQCRYGNVQ